MKVYVSVPSIASKGAGKRELRLVWCWSDRGAPLTDTSVKSGWFGDKAPVTSDLGSGVVFGHSSVFYNMTEGAPAGLFTPLPIYAPRDPQGALSLSIWMYEVDKEYDGIAAKIEEARGTSVVKQVLSSIVSTAYSPLLVAVDLLPAIIREIAKDDLFLQVQFAGFEENSYGGLAEGPIEKTFQSDKVSMTLRAEIFDDQPV